MLIELLDYINRRLLFPWRENRVVSELAPLIKPGSRVLDFGCGDGHLSLSLASRSGADIMGIDTCQPEKLLLPRITYDGKTLPIKDDSFDGVVMVDMLHHTQDVKEAIRKLTRVARDFLLIKDMKYKSRLGYRVLQFTDLWTNSPDPNALLRYNYLTWQQWQEIFEDLNLSIAYVKPSFSLIPLDPIQHLNFIVLLKKRGGSDSSRKWVGKMECAEAERQVRMANKILFEHHTEAFQKLHQGILKGEESYINETLHGLRSKVREGRVLDAGCGDGCLTTVVQRYFPDVTGVDQSHTLLKDVPTGLKRACGDVQHLPFSDTSFSLVLCNYTLHHLYSVDTFIAETYRVLMPGGVLFIDHEMNSGFMRRFRWVIRLYDLLFGLDKRYRKVDPSIDVDQVRMAEYHYYQGQGFSCAGLTKKIEKAGFSNIQVRHHWYGVNPLFNRLFSLLKIRSFPALVSPHFSITAQKPQNLSLSP